MAAMDVSAQQRVVAVGASAGGVKALIRFAAALPSFAPKSLPVNDIDSTDVVLNLTTADESGRYRSLVLLLGEGGLRWGEAAALRVGDVNFLRRRIELHRNAVQVGTRVVIGTLKSNENRTVVLPRFVIDALAETAKGKGREDLLWSRASGGYMGPPASKESWLSGAVARCGKSDPTFPRITAHGLRHTAASLAISAGANPKVVQRMLGHASAAMTLDVYADLFDSDLSSVAESVGKMWVRMSQPHDCSTPKSPLPAPTGTESGSLLSGLN